MSKRGLFLGTAAFLGLHASAYLSSTKSQRKMVADFIEDHPTVFFSANVSAFFLLVTLFSGKARPVAIEEVPIDYYIHLDRIDGVLWEKINRTWDAGRSVYAMITPEGEAFFKTS